MNRKQIQIRIVLTLLLLGGFCAIAADTSDLAYNIAQQRDILLGRYTESKAITLIIYLLAAIGALFIIWRKPKKKVKKDEQLNPAQQRLQCIFKIISLLISTVIAIVVFDIAMRASQKGSYVKSGHSYHRVPNQVFKRSFTDAPSVKFTYPNAVTGFGKIEYTLTVDSQGFRNINPPQKCDWLILGDSFAEGSNVSDEDVWWAIIAKESGRKFYNLGMSGGTPASYYDTLEKFGLDRNPKNVICMIYEGNDFRDSNFKHISSANLNKDSFYKTYIKGSPLRLMFKRIIRNSLSGVGAKRFANDPDVNKPDHPLYPIAWQPAELPAKSGNYYAFDLKRMLVHTQTAESFEKSFGCKQTCMYIDKIKELCDSINAELIIVYAPDKPNVLIDQITASIPADQLRSFLALKAKDLPENLDTEKLKTQMQTRQNLIGQYCEKANIQFICLTEPLKTAIAQGQHCYFTYDQHWSTLGHKVVADFLSEKINFTDKK